VDASNIASAARPRLLIVDDEPANLEMLSRRLSVRGFQLLTAPSGPAALSLIKEARPDLVLLDLMMPGMSGMETLSHIRERISSSELPVIMVTANNDRSAMLDAIRGGANDFLTKPVDLEVLLARVAVQLNMGAAFRKAIADHARIQRRLDTRTRLERLGYGSADKRVYYMTELLNGLRNGEVKLFYQPQINLRTNEVSGAEALLRWHSPTLGIVPPDHFVPMAEETGDIDVLTDWVIAQAIQDREHFSALGHRLRIAVNLSATLVNDSAFVERLIESLTGKADAISLELTESAIFEDPEPAIRNIARFADMGIRVAIDDYGTGMSSLSYIQRLPVHELKIDKMFVTKLTHSHRDPLLVRSTIELAHALDFEVVAEGVENAETLALLRVMGCDLAQGYHFGAPMTVEDFVAYLKGQAWIASSTVPFDAPEFMRRLLEGDQRETA
jgi:EAL domain-containing protein (putative c-di-GMP-specific phosphodiesterase class I)/DNA-binding response OmpR family regulator